MGDSWRVDETFLKVRGRWVYLYRDVDKQGKTVESHAWFQALLQRPACSERVFEKS
jgi:transposase-like protein